MTKDNKKELINLIISIVVMVIASVLVIVLAITTPKKADPFNKIFGEGYTKEKDTTFESNDILSEKYIINGSEKSGVSYIGFINHKFEIDEKEHETSVKLEVFVDYDDKVFYYEYLSMGFKLTEHKEKLDNYLKKFIGSDAKEISTTIENNKHLYAGSTETGENVIDKILIAVEKVAKIPDPLIEVFGRGYKRTADDSFTPGETVSKKFTITSDTKPGVSYVGYKAYTFDSGHGDVKGGVELELFIGEDGNITHYRYLKYEHSPEFRGKIDEYLNKFIGTKASQISTTIAENKSTYAGSTKTGENVIDVILVAIEAEVNK